MANTQLFLDDELIDLYGNTGISITYAHADLDRLTSGNTKGSFSFEIGVPATKVNKRIFDFPELVLEESFDDTTEKIARLEVDGTVVLDGFCRIKRTVLSKDIVNYNLVLHEGNSSWINNIKDLTLKDLAKLETSEINYSLLNHTYDKATMDAFEFPDNFTDPLVSYPVIDFGPTVSGTDVWSVEDRIPSFRVFKVFKDIFKNAGYSLNSSFINSDFFKRLWFTAERLPERSKAEIETHKFHVGLNDIFRLSTDGDNKHLNVDVAVPWDIAIPKNNINFYNGVDSLVSPLGSGSARYNCEFKGRMSFSWDYSLFNNTSSSTSGKAAVDIDLKFFKVDGTKEIPVGGSVRVISIVDAGGGEIKVTTLLFHNLATGNSVRLTGTEYDGTFIVNSTLSATEYKITANFDTQDNDGQSLRVVIVDNNVLLETRSITVPKVSVSQTVVTNVGNFTTISRDVEIGEKYFFAAKLLTSTANNQFVGFSSQTINQFKNNVFQTFVEGSSVVISDVIPDFTQQSFIADIRNMFNLWFHTSEIDKEITIEPRDEFYDVNSLDYSSRLDISKPIEISHLGGSFGKTIKFKYANDSADKYIKFKEAQLQEDEEWLSHEVTNLNKAAKDTTTVKSLKNFAPSFMAAGIGTAPVARIPRIWDSETDTPPENKLKKWKSRILYFRGRTPLPSGSFWSFEGETNFHYPEYTSNYVEVSGAQHDNSLNFTTGALIDGVQRGHSLGLFDKHYANSINTINVSRKYIMWLRLTSTDVLNLDFRKPLYIAIEGDGSFFHLEKIIDYRPEEVGTFKCVLIKVVNPVPTVLLNQNISTVPFIEDEINENSIEPFLDNTIIFMTESIFMSTTAVPAGEFVNTDSATVCNKLNDFGNIANQEVNCIIRGFPD